MAVRPEYLGRTLARARREAKGAWQAADFLEEIIDDHLRTNASDFVFHKKLLFPIADGTDSTVLEDIVRRYRGVGWSVTRFDSMLQSLFASATVTRSLDTKKAPCICARGLLT